ncbi:hypothetical protein [Sphaerisporangium perillae]|uniref:hypothetical protein n=1 Tax=Sphaerisporangium perillae TaxID=2935860 RepID=UPI00200BCF38|nr:hypothetical protein [Sphaerisporangium perillae]
MRSQVVDQVDVYLEDTYLTEVETQILATGRREDATAWVAAGRNPFHPQGGGQPADRGWIDEWEVVPVRDPATGLVTVTARPGTGSTLADQDGRAASAGHDDAPGLARRDGLAGLAEGTTVRARVDVEARLIHAALHTAGHLIEAIGRGQGWALAGNNHFPGQARIEFVAPEPDPRLDSPAGREELAGEFGAAVASAILAGPAVGVDHDAGGRRIVRLGDLHAAPCGGTHVRTLGDLADVVISGMKVKKGRVRVSYSAAHGPRR